MSEPNLTANESITTEHDGPATVNERMTTGGPGPEGQPDTVHERLSGDRAVDPANDSAPAKSALKDEWVDYAVSQGMDRDEAEAMTKQDLIDEYGA